MNKLPRFTGKKKSVQRNKFIDQVFWKGSSRSELGKYFDHNTFFFNSLKVILNRLP